VENRLAQDAGLAPGELFLDFPAKARMLALDLPLVKRDGAVTQLGVPRVSDELYRSARRLRVFIRGAVKISALPIVELVMMPAKDVTERLEQDRPLLSR
jgi:uncharacterized protein